MQINTQGIIHSQGREQKDKKAHLLHLLPIEETALKKDHKNMKTDHIVSLDSQEGITKIQDPHHMKEINIKEGKKHHPQEINSEPHLQKQQDILPASFWTIYLKTKGCLIKLDSAPSVVTLAIKLHNAGDMSIQIIHLNVGSVL